MSWVYTSGEQLLALGRPKNRWENGVKNDLNIMKINNCKDCIQDRHKWKGIVEKSKTFND
jgi:hypothetical protein